MRKAIFLFLAFFVVDIFIYWGLWNTFFQQDEWFLLGRAIYESQHLPLAIFDFASTHFWPLGSLYWIILYKTFGLSAGIHAWIALISHSFAVLLIYYFLSDLLKDKKAAFVSSLLLLVSFPARQIVVWYAVSFALPYSIIFLLLFMLILMRKEKMLSWKRTSLLFALFILSLFFREEAFLLIVLAPVYVLLFWKKERIILNKKKLVLLFISILFIAAIRLTLQFSMGDHVQFEHDKNYIMTAYNMVTVPFKMVAQNIIEYDQLNYLSGIYTRIAFPRLLPNAIDVITVIQEDLVFLLMLPFVFLLGFSFSKADKYGKKVLLYGIIIIISYSFLLSPQTRRLVSLESRYLFFGAVGVLICFYYIYKALLVSKIKWIRLSVNSIAIISIFIFIFYSYTHIRTIINDTYLPISIERESILAQITKLYPSISKNTVFYIECKSQNDCISNGLVLPFQSGVGQMLMVVYAHENENAYAPFFKSFYLWDWEAQAYKKIGDYGFGYYRDKNMLLSDLRKGKFMPDDIIALQYSYSSNKITDITKSFRQQITNELNNKQTSL